MLARRRRWAVAVDDEQADLAGQQALGGHEAVDEPGPGFNPPAMAWDSGAGAWDHSRIKTVAGDFNRDGYTDLGAFYDYGNSRTALFIWSAKPTGGFNVPVMVWDSGNGTWDQPRIKPF